MLFSSKIKKLLNELRSFLLGGESRIDFVHP